MQRATTYREMSRVFLDQAFAELEAGDLQQASEKGWGAAAQILKAVADERGWEHDHHRLLFVAVDRLAAETGNEAISRGFGSASALHGNFYEGVMRQGLISDYLNHVRAFVDAAEGLLNGR